mgnify:CR=1 FL=1
MNLLILWLSSALLLYLTAIIVPGFKITSFPRALIAAIIVGFFNMFLKPILLLLTLPINIITLGLFTFVVNAIILRISAGIMKGFDISGWMTAILGAMVMTLLQLAAHWLFT